VPNTKENEDGVQREFQTEDEEPHMGVVPNMKENEDGVLVALSDASKCKDTSIFVIIIYFSLHNNLRKWKK